MIIGMVGLIGSGKGTVGDYLQLYKAFEKESFAKPLKDAVSVIFNWPRHLLEGGTPESREWRDKVDDFWTSQLGWKVTPRDVLQKMGTEAGRSVFGNPLWTSSLINRLDPNRNYVITDVRFENEIESLKSIGATLIRVKRGDDPYWLEQAKFWLKNYPNETNLYYKADGVIEKIHVSEYGWVNSKMDFIIYNDGNLESLYKRVDSILKQIRDVS